MRRTHSIYLDLLRFLSSLVVVLAHLSVDPFSHETLPFNIASYGSVAVILFFVLSGYVISYVIETKDHNPSTFLVNRLSRLYSVVIPVLVLTFVLDGIGKSLAPAYYSEAKVLLKPPSLSGYLSSLFFVNEYQAFHFHGVCPGTNNPFWSLSFEVTYYILIGLVLFLPLRQSMVLSIALLWVGGKTIAILFPIWLLGFFLYRYRRSFHLSPAVAWGGFILSVLGLLTVPILFKHLPRENFGLYFPWGRGPFNRNILKDYAVAIYAGLNLISSYSLAEWHPLDDFNSDRFVRLLGEMTFPLYAIHYPLICFMGFISPFSRSSYAHILMVVAVCAAVAWALHRLAVPLRYGLKSILATCLLRRASP